MRQALRRKTHPTAHRDPSSTEAAVPELRLGDLTKLSLEPLLQRLHRWWMQRVERHCMICADVEEQRARQAQQNVAYYQKQAALARLSRD